MPVWSEVGGSVGGWGRGDTHAVKPGIQGNFLLELCQCGLRLRVVLGGGGRGETPAVAPGIQGNFLHKLCQCGSGKWGGVRGSACCYTWNPRAFPM